jgi:hypothetical protein
MSERIREIAKKASDNIGMVGFHNIPTEFTKKFAELLLQECLFIIDDERKPEMISRIELWKQMKEHFGV